jgi:hypothetical protein
VNADEKAMRARAKRVLLISTILLAFAAVATAWSSYQAARWTAEYRQASGRANSLRSEVALAQGLANAQTEVDLALFIEWLDARTLGREKLADFYFQALPQGVPACRARLAGDEPTHEPRGAVESVRDAAIQARSGTAGEAARR